jgi:hypothetical protein
VGRERQPYRRCDGPAGRTRRPYDAHASARAAAALTPVGWREKHKFLGRHWYTAVSGFSGAGGVPAPAAGLSRTGQNPSRPSVAAGQPHLSNCPANVHAKTTLTEPCPAKGMAAIGSRDTSGRGRPTVSESVSGLRVLRPAQDRQWSGHSPSDGRPHSGWSVS